MAGLNTSPRRQQRLVMMEPTTTTATATWMNNKSKAPLNPYDVLKVRKDATPSEIVLSYRKLALLHHPGRKRSEIASSCPLQLRRQMEFFEVLAACYETLMHHEFRRRYDMLLKDIEKKQEQQQQNNNNNSSSFIQSRSTKNAAAAQSSYNNNELVVKMADSIPGLIPSTSSSDKEGGSSDDTIPTKNSPNCSSMMFLCGGSSSPPFANDGENTNTNTNNINTTSNFTMSRDGTKGFKSLMDSHHHRNKKTSSVSASVSSSQGGSGEEGEDGSGKKREAEIHFSEATVNRLFGGPLVSLHRARNFQTFTDPYLVFNKVFGCTNNANTINPIIFPRVNATDIHQHHRNHPHNDGSTCTSTRNNNNELTTFNDNKIENGGSYSNRILTRSTSMSSQWNHSRLDGNEVNNGPTTNDEQTATSTKVFVSSRIIHGRKITKTETVHVDPETGMASVNVTVDGEYLNDITTTTNNKKLKKNKKKNTKASSSSQHHYNTGEGGVGAVVSDWLLCFGTSTSKVCPSSTLTTKNNCNPCRRIKSVYIEVLEDFYLCNNNFYEECNRYMNCGGLT